LRAAFRKFLYYVVFVLFMMAGAAFAGDGRGAPGSFDRWADNLSISEVKFGFLKHDVDHVIDITSAREEDGGLDLNAQVLFNGPRFLRWIGSPRPALGATINTEGRTSHVHADLNWSYTFDFGLELGVNGGFAVHDGRIDDDKLDANHVIDKRLGSRVLFHFAPEIGYRFNNGYGIALYWEHLSNGQVLTDTDTNQGLDNVGVRFSYLINTGK
jgi:lipid A 3-O-deacylase